MNEKPTKSNLVVFIDDDEGPMEFYEDALRDGGYNIERIYSVLRALDYIQNTDAQPLLWLVDLMMQIEDESVKVEGQPLIKLASLGLASGRVLYRQIRRKFPDTLVMLLTNMSTPEILDELESEMDVNASCIAKMAMMPSELVALIKKKTEDHGPNCQS